MKKIVFLQSIVISTFLNSPVYGACTDAQTALMNRLFHDGFKGAHMDVLEEVFHPEFRVNAPGAPPGIDSLKKIVRMNNAAFEGWHFTVHELICDRETIVARFTGSGIHNASFMGSTPNGKEVNLKGISIFKIKDNRIIKNWYSPDMLNFLVQLGLIPPVGPAQNN